MMEKVIRVAKMPNKVIDTPGHFATFTPPLLVMLWIFE
jgi:hypothetical protein